MLRVLVTNTKGGCGKTTIATNLAGAFARAGFAAVLADCDRQKASLRWAARRPPSVPKVAAVNWSKEILPLPAGAGRLVMDAPAALRRQQARDLVRMADVVVLPVLPSVFDEDATRRFLGLLEALKPVRKGKRLVVVVGNRTRARTKAATRLDQFLETVGQRAVTRLRDTQLYPTVALSGLSLFDLATLRAEDFVGDWRPLLSFIDGMSARLED